MPTADAHLGAAGRERMMGRFDENHFIVRSGLAGGGSTRRLRRCLLLAGATLSLVPGQACAQAAMAADAAPSAPGGEAAAQPPAAAAPGQSDDDIIVTARRRAESIQHVPVAITAFDENFLQDHAVAAISDLSSFTPGLTVSEASGGAGGIIYLRGIGSTAAHPLIDQAVAINLDGVQISSGLVLRATELDVQQVEVLRGPQALFFGKNSPGGVISFRTADPGDHFEAMLRSGYEFNANELSVEGMASGPITDALRARIAVSYSQMDGWLRIRSVDAVTPFGTAVATPTNRAPDSNEFFLRGTLVYNDGGPFSARAKLTYLHSRNNYGNGFYQQRIFCPLGSAQVLPGTASPAAVAIDDCRADGTVVGGNIPASLFGRDPLIGTDASGFRRNTQWLGSLELNYDLTDALTLTSVTGYYNVDEPQNSQYTFAPIAALVYSVNTTNIEQFSQEVRLASDFRSPLNFLVGGFYEHARKSALTGAVFSTSFVGPEEFIQTSDDWSVFGQLRYHIVPQLELSAGARYSHDSKSADVFVQRVRVPNLTQDHLSFSDFSPEVTLSWEPSANLLIYGSYRQAFKAGGFDAGLGTGSRIRAFPTQSFSYRPEQAEGFEGGVRGRFDRGRGRISLTAYHYKYRDLQYSAFDPSTLGIRITNAAAATIQGIEIDASWRPVAAPGLTLRLTGGYNHSRFDEFRAGCYSGQTIALGCNLDRAPSGAFSSQDLTGSPLSYAPRLSGSVGISYEHDLGPVRFGISGDMFYSSEFWASLEQSPGSLQDDYATFDLSARLSDPGNRWELALIGKNLTDEYVLGRAINVSLTGTNTGRVGPGVLGDLASTVSRGRQVLLQFTWRFGS
jgi:iron complex outermembrane receptor protein